MPNRLTALLLLLLPLFASQCPAAPTSQPAALLEDNADQLLPLLTNEGALGGNGEVEKQTVFSGQTSVKITELQRCHHQLPGWAFPIVEKPQAGQFRYLRFAWKAHQCAGIMLQLHDEKDWNIRYVAGDNAHGWATLTVAPKPPDTWVVITCDLFKDFGPCTITGIALTIFNGGNANAAGYFDHIYLAQSIDDLDRIDATGLRNRGPVHLTESDLQTAWMSLTSPDASKSYLAFWKLVADPQNSVPFLKTHLTPPADGPLLQQFHQWITDLDDDRSKVRDLASQRLAEHLESAEPLLRHELTQNPPPEARARILQLLAPTEAQPRTRLHEAKRALSYMNTPESRKLLENLAKSTTSTPSPRAVTPALRVSH